MRFGVTASSPGLGGGGGGGGGGGATDVSYLSTDGASGQYYTGPAGVMRGADNFVVALFFRPVRRLPNGGGYLLRAGSPGTTNGWGIRQTYEFLQFHGRDGAGNEFETGINSAAASYWGSNGYRWGRDAVIVVQVLQNTATQVRMSVNGVPPSDPTSAPAAGFTVGLSDLIVGDTTEGPPNGIGGVAYRTGTITDVELQEFADACYAAKKLVPGGIAWDRLYSVADSAPAATWAPTVGTGNMTRTGAQLPIDTYLARWA